MLLPQASGSAQSVDSAFTIILWIEVVLLVLVTSAMIIFVIRYRKKRSPKAENIEGGPLLEILWTAIPTLLVLVMFYFGWKSFDYVRKVPENAMNVRVLARQWSWQFTYENGRQSDTLRVPLDKPVKLSLRSQDVLHCLYIPAFRIKEDTVPGLETYLWFTAKEVGSYDIFCTEYCGLGHSGMLSKVVVLPEKEFEAWYAAREVRVEEGLKLLESKGCLGCHSTDGTPKIGPTLKGLYGKRVTIVTGGKERVITADEDYIRKSILDPQSDVVKGFQPVMPKLPLSEDEQRVIVGYLKTLK